MIDTKKKIEEIRADIQRDERRVGSMSDEEFAWFTHAKTLLAILDAWPATTPAAKSKPAPAFKVGDRVKTGECESGLFDLSNKTGTVEAVGSATNPYPRFYVRLDNAGAYWYDRDELAPIEEKKP